MTIAERDGAILREAGAEDLPAVDAPTIEGCAAIQVPVVEYWQDLAARNQGTTP